MLSITRFSLRRRTILLNILAEFSASVLFSLLYFIFISRYISETFNLNYIMLSYAVGLSYFAAVYIPFHTYRIHIIPFISIINALRKKQWRVLWHKIPAQALGASLGVFLFNIVNEGTTQVKIEEIQLFKPNEPYLIALMNAFLAGIICYGFYLIRIMFKAKRLSGTLLLGLLISVLYFLTGTVAGISALNPFGYLFYDLLGERNILNEPFHYTVFVHVIAPITVTILVFYKLRNYLFEEKSKPEGKVVDDPLMRNYDI